MDDFEKRQIELCAVLNLIPYLDRQFVREDGKTTDLQSIVNWYEDPGNNALITDPEYRNRYKLLTSAIRQHEDWGSIRLISQSALERPGFQPDDHPENDLTQGCTFQDSEGNFYVTFRGTGAGKWEDNGDGMTEKATEMQKASKRYFDEMAEEYFAEAYRQGKRITVTGHSKGGNEAQYVFMASDYEYLIGGCVSFDGQGFSDPAVTCFMERYGGAYRDKLEKMVAVCGENDFVHDLGKVIIPNSNTCFVKTSGTGPAAFHMLEHMVGDDSCSYEGLSWCSENDGRGTQGAVGAFAKKLSQNMMQLDRENLHGAAVSLMWITDWGMNDLDKPETLGEVRADGTDFIDLAAHGIPTVLLTLLLSKEGYGLTSELLRSGTERFGPAGSAGIAAGVLLLLSASLPVLFRFGVRTAVIVQFSDHLIDSAQQFTAAYGKLVKFMSAQREAFLLTADCFSEKQSFHRPPKTASVLPPYFRVDTEKLRDYAQRIRDLNRRLAGLDYRLNALYARVSIGSLYRLLVSDSRIGYSGRLERCSVYLEETAEDFIICENSILRQVL